MTAPVQCWSWVTIGSVRRRWGCQAVLIGREWVYVRPGTVVQEGAMCRGCSEELWQAQKLARIRSEQDVARRCTKGFGPGEGDLFRA